MIIFITFFVSTFTEQDHTVASESIPFKKLCRELLIAEQKVLKTELKRWGGDYSEQLVKFAASGEPDRFFVPLILLHTGARVGEVAQLGVNDVKKGMESGASIFTLQMRHRLKLSRA